MDPESILPPKLPHRFPRTRGDGPVNEISLDWSGKFPPHTRGWTFVGLANIVGVAVSPAHAGMDLLDNHRPARRSRFPRVLIVRGNAGVTDQHCIMVLQNQCVLQYRFATLKPLKTRPGPDRCKNVPLCNRPVVDSMPAVPLFPPLWMIPDRSSPSRVRFAASRLGLLRADLERGAVYEGKGVDGPGCRVASGRVNGPEGNLSAIPTALSRS